MIHLEEAGAPDGIPLVVLNGIPSSLDWADSLVKRVERTHGVYVPHLPGYGRTPARQPYVWGEVIAALEEALMPKLRAPAVLVAFSGGVWRALELAVRGRLAVRGVLGIGGTAQTPEAERVGLRQLATALRAGFDATSIAAERFLATRRDAEAVAVVQSWVHAVPGAALADELEAFAAEPDLLPRLASLRCPVVLRTGSADLACPPEKARAVGAVVAHARVEIVPGAGHALWLEADRDVFDLSGL